MDLEGVDEPLRLPVGVVEEEPDEGEAPDVRFRVAVGLPDLTVVGLPQFPPPPLGGRGPAPPLTSASLYLCQSLSVDMRSERGGGVEAHSNQNCSIESNHATRQKRFCSSHGVFRRGVPKKASYYSPEVEENSDVVKGRISKKHSRNPYNNKNGKTGNRPKSCPIVLEYQTQTDHDHRLNVFHNYEPCCAECVHDCYTHCDRFVSPERQTYCSSQAVSKTTKCGEIGNI